MDSVTAGERALSRLAQSTDFRVSTSKRCFGAPRQPLGLHYDFCSTDARRPAAHVGAERGIEWPTVTLGTGRSAGVVPGS